MTSGRFELEREGNTAFLEYKLKYGVLTLLHTEVPRELHGRGIGSGVVREARDYAREKGLKIDVLCPFVGAYLKQHPGRLFRSPSESALN